MLKYLIVSVANQPLHYIRVFKKCKSSHMSSYWYSGHSANAACIKNSIEICISTWFVIQLLYIRGNTFLIKSTAMAQDFALTD